MSGTRRNFLRHLLVYSASLTWLGSNLFTPKTAYATWLAQNFEHAELNDVLARMYPNIVLTESDAIVLKLPKNAENGAVVPITISSSLPKVTEISIFVAKNPSPLSATFKLSPDLDPFVSARIKMAETSSVLVVVTSDGQFYKTKQDVQVTIGGCGG
jgi:sulfur-oxidizing protein SoxY